MDWVFIWLQNLHVTMFIMKALKDCKCMAWVVYLYYTGLPRMMIP